TLTTETQGNSGNRALGEVHDKVRGDIALDDANLVEETMNQLIRWIWELNRPGDLNVPRFAIQMPEDLQLGRIERDSGLYKLGARYTPDYFKDIYGVAPHHLSGVEAMRTGGASSFAEHGHGCRCKHDHGHAFAEANELETLLRSFTPQELQSQVAELVQPILDLAERSGGADEFSQALDELFPHLTTRQMEASLEKCLLLAEMQGKANANPS
ncbi:MAG TPA: DUF935 family protein, partial [Fibrobacteria bacterium]|nr:DUF935 family protein [Fibrobacteria bacterium]